MDIVIFVATILFSVFPITQPEDYCDPNHYLICNSDNNTTECCCISDDAGCSSDNQARSTNLPGSCSLIISETNRASFCKSIMNNCSMEIEYSMSPASNNCSAIHTADCSGIGSMDMQVTAFSCMTSQVQLMSSSTSLVSLPRPTSSSSSSSLLLSSSLSSTSPLSTLPQPSPSSSSLSSSSLLSMSPLSLFFQSSSPSSLLQSRSPPSNTSESSSTGLQAIYYLVGSIIFLFSVTIIVLTIVIITVKITQQRRSGALIINSTNSPRNKGMDQSDAAYYTECGPILSPVYGLQTAPQTYEEPVSLINQQHHNTMEENGRNSAVESCINRAYEPSIVDPTSTEEELKKNIYDTIKSPEDISEEETLLSRKDEYVSLSEVTISTDSLDVEDAKQDLLDK